MTTAYQDKRNAILRHASDIFARKGYYGTGLQEILTACDIPKGSFYHYFPGGKEALAIEIVRYAYQSMADGINAHLFSISDDALEVFSHMLWHLANDVLRDNRMMQSLLLTFLGIESVYISPKVSEACSEAYASWQRLYEEKLKACGYDAEMAKKLSLALFALVHGAMISSWIKQDNSDLLAMKEVLPLLLPAPRQAAAR